MNRSRLRRTILAAVSFLLMSSTVAWGFVANDNGWTDGTVTFLVKLGSPSSPLSDGSTTWSQVVTAGIAEWNPHLNDIQLASVTGVAGGGGDEDGTNDIFFSATRYGMSFGSSTLAITLTSTRSVNGGPFLPIESDIVFNTAFTWDSYRGASRTNEDLRRVLIHELGHAIGLNHPDEAGQSVSAIMNAFSSDIDTVTADDIAGAQSLYGDTGTGGGGGGDTVDSFEDDDTAGTASSIANGATQTHSIHEVGDKDWVTFTLPSGATNLRIETAGSSGDTEIFLFGPNSSTTLLDENDDGGDGTFSLITAAAPGSGVYYLRVEEYFNNATITSYTVSVSWSEATGGGDAPDAYEVDNSAGSAKAISNGETQNRSIHQAGDIDWVTFTIGAGGATNLTIETHSNEVNDDTVLTLYGPNSSTNVIATNDDIQNSVILTSRITRSSLAPGTYYAKVNEYLDNHAISAYTLRASWTDTPVTGGGGGEGGGAKLSNLSVRAKTGGEFGTLILGFATSTAAKQVLIRGIGPTLAEYEVTGAIPDPRMEMVLNSVVIDSADDWQTEANASEISTVGASLGAFPPQSIREAILLRSVDPAAYTVLVTDFQGETGQVLIEAYDADGLSAPGRLTNLSTRTEVGGAAGILTAGFVVAGEGNVTLLIRGVGPTLASLGVAGTIPDPKFQVLDGNQQVVGANDDWGSGNASSKRTVATQVGAFALLEGSLDAALLITLGPGSYTVQMDGVSSSSGNGLVEIYEVP